MFRTYNQIFCFLTIYLAATSIGHSQSQFQIDNTGFSSCSGTITEGNLQGSFSLTRVDQNGFNGVVDFNKGTISGVSARNNWILGNGPAPNPNGIDMFEYNLSVATTDPSIVETITIKRMVDNAGGTAELADFTVTWQGCGQGKVVDPDDQLQNFADGDSINSGDVVMFRPGTTGRNNALNTWEIVVHTDSITIKVEAASLVSSDDMLYNEWISFEVDLTKVDTNYIQTCSNSDISGSEFILPPTGSFTWDNTNPGIGLPGSGNNTDLDFSAVNTGSSPVSGEISISTCLGLYSVSIITVNPIPQIDAGEDVIACEDLLIALSASSNSTYSWDNGIIDGVGFYPPLGTTTYIATTEKNSSDCFNTDTVEVTINQIPSFELSPDVYFICNGEVAIDLPSTGATYHWDNISSTSYMEFDTPGEYIITATNNSNCIATDTITIHEDCESSIVIPNVFSPNNDNINDLFIITGEDISQFQLFIYDRWGHLIFETTDINEGWNGQNKAGKDVSAGTYYIVTQTSANNIDTITETGHLTLIR